MNKTISFNMVLLLATLTMLDAMAIDLYLPGTPFIAIDFATSSTKVQQTLAAFFIGLAVGQALYGPILDRFGRKLPVLIGVIIFILGSIVAACAPNVEWLLIARIIQAFGASAGLVAPRAIISDLYDAQSSARIFSYLMQVIMIVPIVAPLIGAQIIEYSSWRITFWLLVILGIMCFIWIIYSLPESLPAQDRMPFTFTSMLKSYWQQTKLHIFMLYCVAGGFMLGMLFIYLGIAPFVFSNYFHLSATQISYALVLSAICSIIFIGINTYLLGLGVKPFKLMMSGIFLHLLIGIIFIVSTLIFTPDLMWYCPMLALTLGCLGLTFGNMTALNMQHAGEQAGVASALMGVLGYLIAAILSYLASFAPQTYTNLPILLVACGFVSGILCLITKKI